MRTSRAFRASRARPTVLVLIVSLTLVLGLVPAAAAAETAPIPTSMAAVGDSITQAASSAGSLGADAPQNSWSTGWSSSVDSHAERLGIATASAHNLSVSGAKVGDLRAQMLNVAGLSPDPGYLTVLIGGNDLCTDTVESMTSETAFETAFMDAMSTLYAQSPGTHVYVVSIPDVYQLWELFKGNFWARFIWSSADICQSLLANPTSTKKVDEDRRLAVRARNQAYNAIMASICDSESFRSRCHHDHGAAFGTELVASDVSGDYFHPSASGQNRLAQRSWEAGYTFGTETPPENQAPTASFTASCLEWTCSFDASGSNDDGSIVGYAWNFGDSSQAGSGAEAAHTYETDGTFMVTLTVTDDEGVTASAAASVTVPVEAPPPDPVLTLHIADLDGEAILGKGPAWTANVTVAVANAAGDVIGATVTGDWSTGGSATCTSTDGSTCRVSVSLNSKRVGTTTFTVTDVVRDGYEYVQSENVDADGDDSNGTSIVVTR